MKNLNLLRKLWMLPLFCLALNLHAQGVAKTKPSPVLGISPQFRQGVMSPTV